MTGTLTLDDIDIVRDSNGNLVIRDDTDTTVATYDTTDDEWQFADDIDLGNNSLLNAVLGAFSVSGDITDAASGSVVYDSSAEEVKADVNNESVSTDDATLTDTSTDPSSAGELRQNAGDVKAYSGGAVRNLSNIGSGAGDVATVTVAASGSSYSADYVCDGTDDHTTINNAINSLPAAGGSVVLTEGTYNLGGAVSDQGKSNVHLAGQGWGTHLLLDGGVTDNVLETIGVSNWRVSNLRLDGNGANQSDGGDDFDQCGWFADNCDNLHFDNATSRNAVMCNIRWVAQDGNTHTDYRVTDSWLHNTIGSDGSTASPDAYSITVRNGSAIERATCSDSLLTQCSHQSIEWVGISKGSVTGNIIYSDKPESASNGVMTGMNIHSTTAGTTSNITISGNYVEVPNADATQIAASGPRMTVTGNMAVGGNSAGVAVTHPQNTDANATVSGNYCLNNDVGIGVNGVASTTITGNTVKGASSLGIKLNSPQGVVGLNTVRDSGDHGIQILAADSICGLNTVTGSTNASIDDQGTDTTLVWNQTDDGLGRGPSASHSGSVTLSSGTATVDTGISTGTTATFMLALGPDTTDADVAGDIRADSGTGTYVIDVEETDTSVGNPTVDYDVVRVR